MKTSENSYSLFEYMAVCAMLVLVGYILAQIAGLGNALNENFKIADYLTLIVAIFTFTFSYLGIKHNREQRVLSVMPHVDKVSIGDSVAGECGLYIKNYGLAPAINIKLDMYIDGKHDDGSKYEELRRKYFRSSEDFIFYSAGINALSPNDGGYLFKIEVESKDIKKYQTAKEFLSKITVLIEYESVLGQKFEKSFSY